MKRFVLCIAAQMGLLGLVGLVGPVQAGSVGFAVDSKSTLYTVDLAKVTAKAIGSTGVSHMEGLALAPDGALFGTDSHGILYSVSSTTGQATRIGDTRLGDIESLTFSGSTLLGANYHDPTTIFSINTTNASATPLVTTNPAEGPIRAMAAENSTTVLSLSDTPNFQTLIATDLQTGATSALGRLDSTSLFAAMAFGPNGALYGIDVSGNEYIIGAFGRPPGGSLLRDQAFPIGLQQIAGAISPAGSPNLAGNVPTILMGTLPDKNITDFTTPPSVAEPSSWVSAAIGILVLAVYACARRLRTASV